MEYGVVIAITSRSLILSAALLYFSNRDDRFWAVSLLNVWLILEIS